MGLYPHYVYNADGGGSNKEMSSFQVAQADATTGGGDTLTAYAVEYRATGTIASVADNGPYITLTTSDEVVGTADDYIGNYLYMTAGTNDANIYLIIDSDTAGGPADTLSIYTAATAGFGVSDTFKILDRKYDTKGWDNGTSTVITCEVRKR